MRRAALAVVALGMLASTGCGGGSDSKPPVPFSNPTELPAATACCDGTLDVEPAQQTVAGE